MFAYYTRKLNIGIIHSDFSTEAPGGISYMSRVFSPGLEGFMEFIFRKI